MKVYTLDGQYAAIVIISDKQVSVEGPFAEEIREIIGEDRITFIASVTRDDGTIGDIAEVLLGNSAENTLEFLQYPRYWGYKVKDLDVESIVKSILV